MEEKQRIGFTRAALLFVVLLSHVLLLMPMLRLSTFRSSPSKEKLPPLEIFWFDSQVKREPRVSPATAPKAAVMPEAITVPTSKSVPPIDWNAEVGDVARSYIHKEEERARQRKKFAPLEARKGLESKEKLDAGWNEYRFKRIESKPGSTVIHLNERCFIAISGGIMPVCKLGKIKGGGQMYERMKQSEREKDELRQDAVP